MRSPITPCSNDECHVRICSKEAAMSSKSSEAWPRDGSCGAEGSKQRSSGHTEQCSAVLSCAQLCSAVLCSAPPKAHTAALIRETRRHGRHCPCWCTLRDLGRQREPARHSPAQKQNPEDQKTDQTTSSLEAARSGAFDDLHMLWHNGMVVMSSLPASCAQS